MARSRHTPAAPGSRVVSATHSDTPTTHLVEVLGVSRPCAIEGSREERIAQIAKRQRGRVAHAQLLAAGIANRTIYRLVASGHLHREHRGVYAVGHTAPAPLADETAALLACGEHAVLSHYTAVLMHRLIPHGDGRIHVTIRGRHGPDPTGVTVHRTKALTRGEVTTLHGLPVTSPIRTIFDLASGAEVATVERAVEEGLVQRLVSERALRAHAATVTGQRSATLVTAIFDAHSEPGITKSKAERRFRALLRAAQLPPPLTNVRVHGYSLDCYWPDLGVVVEVQGYQFHSTRRKFEHDTRKAAALAAAGLSVSYVTWLQMENEPFAVVARVAQTLAVAQALRN
jgi:very-short-patch-repair endonuclease/predicted transcriptional regulator of viral defense system